jgi:hypothetical protein
VVSSRIFRDDVNSAQAPEIEPAKISPKVTKLIMLVVCILLALRLRKYFFTVSGDVSKFLGKIYGSSQYRLGH